MGQFQGDDQLQFDWDMQQPAYGVIAQDTALFQSHNDVAITNSSYPWTGHPDSWSRDYPYEYASTSPRFPLPTPNSICCSATSPNTNLDLWTPWPEQGTAVSRQETDAEFQDLNVDFPMLEQIDHEHSSTEPFSLQECEALGSFFETNPLGQSVLWPTLSNVGDLKDIPQLRHDLLHDSVDNHHAETSVKRDAMPHPGREEKAGKSRLVCSYPGCKSTFPRRYELQRHENAIHKKTVSMPCPIYGCKRVAKPFPRIDKFREHMKGHKDPGKFLCIIETCRMGPLTRRQLQEHLAMRHHSDYSDQPQLGDYMMALRFLGTKFSVTERSLFHFYEKRKEGKDACPIRGCDFRLSLDHPAMEDHLDSHDLIARLQSHQDLEQLCPKYDFSGGLVICPICQKDVHNFISGGYRLYRHIVDEHSAERESASMQQFCQFLASVPGLKGKVYYLGEIVRRFGTAARMSSI